MITLTREEAHGLLAALEELNRLSIGKDAICLPAEIDDAMEILEARLAQPEPEQKWKYDPMTGEPLIDGWPLYSGLPKPWQGLTDEEIKSLLWETRVDNLTFARVIEKVLREKNAS
jgi:hypothetical protein